MGGTINDLILSYKQGDQLNMAVFSGTFENDLSSVHDVYRSAIHWKGHLLENTAMFKWSPCTIMYNII